METRVLGLSIFYQALHPSIFRVYHVCKTANVFRCYKIQLVYTLTRSVLSGLRWSVVDSVPSVNKRLRFLFLGFAHVNNIQTLEYIV